MKFKNIGVTFDIRPVDAGVVQVELAHDDSKLRMTFGISAKDALKWGRALVAAGRKAGDRGAAQSSSRIASRLLKKARRS